jgi:hypothetical protein
MCSIPNATDRNPQVRIVVLTLNRTWIDENTGKLRNQGHRGKLSGKSSGEFIAAKFIIGEPGSG